MRRPSKLKPCGNDCSVQIDDRAELGLDTQFHHAWRQRTPIEHPASAIGKLGKKDRQQARAVVVTEALNFERLHEESSGSVHQSFISFTFFIGASGLKRDRWRGTVVM
jgi:hypothetical protein